jgi:hypothetical protein
VKGAAAALPSFIAAIVLTLAPASAGSITAYVRPQPDAPVQITACGAGVQFLGNQWGAITSTLNLGADFTNVSNKPAIEVVFRMRLSNALGDPMDNVLEQSTGQFAPNAPIKGNHWAQTDSWPGLGEVQCSIARVLFSDGTDWTAPKSTPSDGPSSNP